MHLRVGIFACLSRNPKPAPRKIRDPDLTTPCTNQLVKPGNFCSSPAIGASYVQGGKFTPDEFAKHQTAK
jgi:hypothetical protein